MHSPPGARYRHAAAPGTAGEAAAAEYGNDATYRMMNIDLYYEEFKNTWRKIVRRFKGRPYLYGYNLVNEPAQTTPVNHSYLQLQYETALVIRELLPMMWDIRKKATAISLQCDRVAELEHAADDAYDALSWL